MQLKRATLEQAKLRLILTGGPGTGKTRSALETAKYLVPGGKILLLDSERGSASKYAKKVPFFVEELLDHDPRNYTRMIKEGGQLVDVLIIDSLTHAWDRLLEIVDEVARSRFSGNTYAAWSVGTPIWRDLLDAMMMAPCHVIATARADIEYVEDNSGKKKQYTQVGTKVQARKGLAHEFDVHGELDLAHDLMIRKTRCDELDQRVFNKPGAEFAGLLRAWLSDGEPAMGKPVSAPAKTPEIQPAPAGESVAVSTIDIDTTPGPVAQSFVEAVADAVDEKSQSNYEALVKHLELLGINPGFLAPYLRKKFAKTPKIVVDTKAGIIENLSDDRMIEAIEDLSYLPAIIADVVGSSEYVMADVTTDQLKAAFTQLTGGPKKNEPTTSNTVPAGSSSDTAVVAGAS
jgi:hypothetical protein